MPLAQLNDIIRPYFSKLADTSGGSYVAHCKLPDAVEPARCLNSAGRSGWLLSFQSKRQTIAEYVCPPLGVCTRAAHWERFVKRYHRRNKAEFADPEFAMALCGSESKSLSSGRQAQRKAQQFCRQVQRALNLALADLTFEDHLTTVFVEEVSPAPDCGRLLVQVLISGEQSVSDAMNALRRAAPGLRSEVAAAISRKRAPELSFVPVIEEETGDE